MFLIAMLQRSLARVAGILAGLSLFVISLQVLLVLFARSQEESQSFDVIGRLAPGFMQRQFGDAFSTFLSFAGLVTFAYFDPVVMLLVAVFAAFVATELAADVETGQVDLLLARPLARYWLVTRSLLAVIAAPAALVLVMVLAGIVALQLFAPPGARWPRAGAFASLAVHLAAIAWCFGALGLAVSAFARRRMTALGVTALSAASLYMLEFLGNAWAPAATVAILSPFHYFHGAAVLAGSADSVRDFAVLGSIALACTAIAYWRFETRDV
jgi:ABC-2 type transport system permease protein